MPRKSLRLGMMAFTNAAGFRLVPPAFGVEWFEGDPSELAAEMAAGRLEGCLLPTGAFETMGDAIRPLGPYGIGCRGQVLSVRLFSKVAVRDLLQPECAIFITPRTTTTRELVTELFLLAYGRRPRLTSVREEASAVVLIGDEALDFTREEYRWPVSQDLSEWWFEETGMPFVFAQWVASRSAEEEDMQKMRDWIEENLACANTDQGRQRMRAEGVAAGWSEDLSELYFSRLDYRLTPAHLEGLARFRGLLKGRDHAD